MIQQFSIIKKADLYSTYAPNWKYVLPNLLKVSDAKRIFHVLNTFFIANVWMNCRNSLPPRLKKSLYIEHELIMFYLFSAMPRKPCLQPPPQFFWGNTEVLLKQPRDVSNMSLLCPWTPSLWDRNNSLRRCPERILSHRLARKIDWHLNRQLSSLFTITGWHYSIC